MILDFTWFHHIWPCLTSKPEFDLISWHKNCSCEVVDKLQEVSQHFLGAMSGQPRHGYFLPQIGRVPIQSIWISQMDKFTLSEAHLFLRVHQRTTSSQVVNTLPTAPRSSSKPMSLDWLKGKITVQENLIFDGKKLWFAGRFPVNQSSDYWINHDKPVDLWVSDAAAPHMLVLRIFCVILCPKESPTCKPSKPTIFLTTASIYLTN